jgi:hypothetical protein
VDNTEYAYQPLTAVDIAYLLEEARTAGDAQRVSRVQVRLVRGIQGITSPYPAEGPVAERMARLEQLFVTRYTEGASPTLVTAICELLNG